ncbi:uncharacterized protein C5L36_0A07880 [Pichia kudriavzevii]|uniref:Uncharacterized protein n=1 Tax=Pichia kudriavzevii TaxID=4909 RepID=A0A2U9QZ67_PICKU|nr:uncharacterized protein C5L36_0A07880 [Pichia kudriavzevii]AWU74188.1 hypothetical protein C5L36_0A07880 [Pichia kudriavzevii]
METTPSSSSKGFDQRLNSKLSIERSRLATQRVHDINNDLHHHSKSLPIDVTSIGKGQYKFFQWYKLCKIQEQIDSSYFKAEYGLPSLVCTSDEYIAIATSECYILLFSYTQILVKTIKTNNIEPSVWVESMAVSVDSTFLLAGYSNGLINLWDLKKPEPIISVRPVTLHELKYSGKYFHVGHFEGVPVRSVSFIGTRHTAFISSDDSGLVLHHNGGRSLLRYYCNSRVIYGEDNNIEKLLHNETDYSKSILDLKMLPIGSGIAPTDNMGIVAIMTYNRLTLRSLYPSQNNLEIFERSNDGREEKVSGNLAWYPAISGDVDNNNKVPLLAYSWTSSIYLIELHCTEKEDSLGEMQHVVTVVKRGEMKLSESVISLYWLTKKILVAFTESGNLLFIDSQKLMVLRKIDDLSNELEASTVYANNKIGLSQKTFNKSISTYKSNLFIMGRSEFKTGSLLNWADILLDLLNNQNYEEALEEAKAQYEGSTEDLALLSLPTNDEVRHKLMRGYLIQVLKSSTKYLFNSKDASHGDLKRRTRLAIQTCMVLNVQEDFYEIIYDRLQENEQEHVFFEVIEELIFRSKPLSFSPSILHSMIEFYAKRDDIDTLEHLICFLDIKQLDIDLTVQLCHKYQLNETLTYIWTSLLHDYITPLINAIAKIKKYYQVEKTLSEELRIQRREQISYVYPYISYTLTGRQYPTEHSLLPEDNTPAKLNIYYFLFNGSPISWPEGAPILHTVENITEEPMFPYLSLLLQYDSNSMVSCLNEAFEDELLNDTRLSYDQNKHYELHINRQLVIEILLGLIHNSSDQFHFVDKIRICIFISRNYSKYPQFIRLADSVLDEIIDLLCQAKDLPEYSLEIEKDCELALQSLLSVYRPYDTDVLLLKIEKAGHFQVLQGLYQSEEKYVQLLELWVRLRKAQKVSKDWLLKPAYSIIEESFNVLDSYDMDRLVRLISENFEMFVETSPSQMARIISTKWPDLNSLTSQITNHSIKFEYLKAIFEAKEEEDVAFVFSDDLRMEYLKGLTRQLSLLKKKPKVDDAEVKNFDLKIRKFLWRLSSLSKDVIELLEANNVEILIQWLVEHGEYQGAIIRICDILQATAHDLTEHGYQKELEDRVWNCLDLGFRVVKANSNILKGKKEGITLREALTVRLVEKAANILKSLMEEQKEVKAIDIFKRVVQTAFQFVICVSQDDPRFFNTIFQRFLDGSSTHNTTLGDVRVVLKEVFISYRNDHEILTLIKTLIDQDTFENLEILESLKLRGRSPENIECESCGKKIWGGKIGNIVYESWRDHQLQSIHLGLSCDTATARANSLFIFNCRHTYHRKCLENMGTTKDEDQKCILCESERLQS